MPAMKGRRRRLIGQPFSAVRLRTGDRPRHPAQRALAQVLDLGDVLDGRREAAAGQDLAVAASLHRREARFTTEPIAV